MKSKAVLKASRAILAGSLMLAAWQVYAAPFTFTTPNFGLPAFPGDGLVGSVWANVAFPASLSDRTISWAQTYASNTTPDSAFVATTVDYPQGSTPTVLDRQTSIATFLGSDAASLTNPAAGSNMLMTQNGGPAFGTIMQFAGYYRVDTAGSIFFNIASDDGASITIQGTQIALNDGIHPFGTLASPVEVSFTNPGLYKLEIEWFDGENVDGGVAFGTGVSNTIVAQSLLYQSPIPEPASIVLLGTGISALVVLRRKRRAI